MESGEILICILSSAAAAAAITSAKEIIIWVLNRKAKVKDEDKEENDTVQQLKTVLDEHQECLSGILETMKAIQENMSLMKESDKTILKDKIIYLIKKYLEYGEITFEEKLSIQHMWHKYHFDLEGNGDLDEWMELLETIKVIHSSHVHCDGMKSIPATTN